jgi:DNA-binding response OmpR family regulator
MPHTRILLVEDDYEIASLIERYLSREGYEIKVARDGKAATEEFAQGDYSLVILDLILPRVGGMSVLRSVRNSGEIPVIILSSRKEEADKVAGLGLGADDYMTKPFSMVELTARVKAQLRRYRRLDDEGDVAAGKRAGRLSIAGLVLDPERMSVTVQGRAAELTSTEFELLRLLVSDIGSVYTKSQIVDAIWGRTSLTDESVVMVHVSNLRRKLGDESGHPRLIRTVWGIGYKFGEEAEDGS